MQRSTKLVSMQTVMSWLIFLVYLNAGEGADNGPPLIAQKDLEQSADEREVLLSKLRNSTLDMGESRLGVNVVRFLKLINDTSETITFAAATGSCQCANVRVSSDEVRPNEAWLIELTLSSSRGGRQTATIYLHSSDSSVYPFNLRWTVNHELIVEPESLDFGLVDSAETTSKRFIIRRVRLDGTRTCPSGLKVSTTDSKVLSVAVLESNEWELTLRNAGSTENEIGHVQVTDDQMPSGAVVTFPVYWQKRTQPYMTLPKMISVVPKGEFGEGSLLIFSRLEAMPDVVDVSSDAELVEWRFDRLDAKRGRLYMKFRAAPEEQREFKSEIMLKGESYGTLSIIGKFPR